MTSDLEDRLESIRNPTSDSERNWDRSNRRRFFRRDQAAKVKGFRGEQTPNHGTWITAGLTLLLVLWSASFVIYFFSLPTDGWAAVQPNSFGEAGLVYRENLSGQPSGLHPGDVVVQIEGIPLSVTGQGLLALGPKWRAGNVLAYTVRREGTTQQVPVPLTRWQFAPALRYWIEESGSAIALAGGLIFLVTAALAFVRRPANPAAQTLFFFASLFVVLPAPIKFFISSPAALSNALMSAMGAVTVLLAYTLLMPATLLQLVLVFPRPKPVVVRHPWIPYAPYLVGMAFIPLFMVTNGVAGYAWTILSIVGAIAILMHTAFTTRDAMSRAQLLWGLWGSILAWVMFLANYLAVFGLIGGVLADVTSALNDLSFSVLGITLAIAITRYRLFDIEVIIRRTLVYGMLTALLLVFYFGSVILLQQAFHALSGQGQDLAIILSTLAIAALVVPLRNRVQKEIDRRFYRGKYDAAKVLEAFAATARDEVDLGRLTDNLTSVVEETMRPESVSVWLKTTQDERRRTRA